MAAFSWLSKIFGAGKAERDAGAAASQQPELHPIVARVSAILSADYSRPEYSKLAEQLAAMLARAGRARALKDRELVAAFAILSRHALEHAPDAEWREDVKYWYEIVPRYEAGGEADRVDVVAAGSSLKLTVDAAEKQGEAASAALRRAAEGGEVPPEVGQRFDETNRVVRAAKGVMQSLAVLGYVRGVSADWAIPDEQALERLYSLAGENAARQVLSVDRARGLALLKDLLKVCHES